MELQKENDRASILEFCESSRKTAHSMSFLCVEGLNSKNQTKAERIRGISFKIEDVKGQMKVLNRSDYILNRNSTEKLFELFQNLGYLANMEEMDKLLQVMILSETFCELHIILLNAGLVETPDDRLKNDYEIVTGTLSQEESAIKAGLNIIQKRVPLVSLPSTIDDLSRVLACHDWSVRIEKLHFICKTTEIKCMMDSYKLFNPDLTYANLGRSGLLFSKGGKHISAHLLSSTSCEKLTTRAFIMNTIAQCKKKG